MKIKVDFKKCQGNARCWSLAPDVYKLDDSGYILDGDIEVLPGQEAVARRGARACPERALTVEGED
ncbi:probable ferredoxin [alpha proteobacterium U9-1i]|nr:probable ferredoxin [alpha proteobacterium U9-1i]